MNAKTLPLKGHPTQTYRSKLTISLLAVIVGLVVFSKESSFGSSEAPIAIWWVMGVALPFLGMLGVYQSIKLLLLASDTDYHIKLDSEGFKKLRNEPAPFLRLMPETLEAFT